MHQGGYSYTQASGTGQWCQEIPSRWCWSDTYSGLRRTAWSLHRIWHAKPMHQTRDSTRRNCGGQPGPSAAHGDDSCRGTSPGWRSCRPMLWSRLQEGWTSSLAAHQCQRQHWHLQCHRPGPWEDRSDQTSHDITRLYSLQGEGQESSATYVRRSASALKADAGPWCDPTIKQPLDIQCCLGAQAQWRTEILYWSETDQPALSGGCLLSPKDRRDFGHTCRG